MIGWLLKTAMTHWALSGGAAAVGGYFANKKINEVTGNAFHDKVVAPLAEKAKAKFTTVAEHQKEKIEHKLEDATKREFEHWGATALAAEAAAVGALIGIDNGTLSKLAFGVLTAGALYCAFKYFANPKADFNTQSGADNSAPHLALSGPEPELN